MTITAITTVADFSTISGVIDTNTTYHTVAPSLSLPVGTYTLTDLGRINNEVFKFHLRLNDTDSTSFKIMLGCDNAGIGRAIQFDFSSTQKFVRLVNASGFDVAYDSVIEEKDIQSFFVDTAGLYVACRVEISNNKLRFYYGERLMLETIILTTVGTYWGFCNLTSSTQLYVSDTFVVQDQILFGNVNLNGAADEDGNVIVYNQSTYEVYEYTECDANGEYMVFLDDDPVNQNKYFLYGYVLGIGTVQPRGVSNITL